MSFEETIHVDVNITIIHTNVSEASERNWSFCARNLSRDRISSSIFLVLIQYIKKQEGSCQSSILSLVTRCFTASARWETIIHTSKFMNFQLRSSLPFSCPYTNFLFFYKFFLFSISFFVSKKFKNLKNNVKKKKTVIEAQDPKEKRSKKNNWIIILPRLSGSMPRILYHQGVWNWALSWGP